MPPLLWYNGKEEKLDFIVHLWHSGRDTRPRVSFKPIRHELADFLHCCVIARIMGHRTPKFETDTRGRVSLQRDSNSAIN